MKMRKKLSVLAAAVLATLTAPALQAQGFYVGAGVGQSDFRDACDGLADIGLSCDDTDTGWKLFGGFQFTPNWGVEAFYADLGEASVSGTVLGLPAAEKVSVDGFGIAGTATWPIGDRFGVFGKLGVFRWSLDDRATLGGVSFALDDNGTDLMAGLGARYAFTEQFGVRLEWERFFNVGNSNTGDSDIDLFTVGATFSF